MAAVLAGANFILHSAGWLEGGLSMGYEKLLLDADYLGGLHTYLRGLTVDDNALALEAFKEVGPGKHFFGCAHTMANYETAFHDYALTDNNSFEQWQDEGSKDALTRASTAWREQLAGYQAPEIDPGVDEALREFVAKKKQSMPDMWH